jgi:hypothetical protein
MIITIINLRISTCLESSYRPTVRYRNYRRQILRLSARAGHQLIRHVLTGVLDVYDSKGCPIAFSSSPRQAPRHWRRVFGPEILGGGESPLKLEE